MPVHAQKFQMEAEVANTVSVFCKRASWIDDNFATPAGRQSFRKSFFSRILTHILLKQMILLL